MKAQMKVKEADVVCRLFAWIKQVLTIVGDDGIVVMLAGSVDAVKWLFMEQTCKTMLFSCLPQDIHGDLVLVNSNISFEKIGASSNCPGAASLCSVLA
jgi:hypothetical protein